MTTLNYEYFQDGQKQLHSVGCSLITNDIRKLSKSLPDDKIIIFGTCSYIGEAENYSKFLIDFLHKCFPEYKIYAAGCDVNYDKEFYNKFDKSFTNDMLEKYENNNIKEDSKRISIKIQDGCSNNCSYCVINKLRNHPHSLSYDNILNQISNDNVDIELYGTEICYYYDKKSNKTLIDLLDSLLKDKPNINSISLSSIDPSSPLIFDLIDFIGNHTKIIPHIILAVQSGSDKIIKDMNRHYDSEKIKKIHNFAETFNISIGWELIIGFPSESDNLFNETRSLFNLLKPIDNTIFKYSPRETTISYNMKQLKDDLVNTRIKLLLDDESKWLGEKIENSSLKNYYINVKHLIPELTYNRLIRKFDQKNYINIISITSEDSLIDYVRKQYYNLEEPKELYIKYYNNVEFILKFFKEFLPKTKITLLVDNDNLDEKEYLVDFGCKIRRI